MTPRFSKVATMPKLTEYQKRAYAQGVAWVNGRGEHNQVDDECLPDFSCCAPNLYVESRTERLAMFRRACNRHQWPIYLDA